jgi:ferredoxin
VLVLVAEPPAELHAKVEDAADGCPRAAIRIDDE